MTNHTDKELLMLAARAAGFDISHPMNIKRQEMSPPVLGVVTYLNGVLQSTLWNPFDDDGQALRLAVKFEMSVEHHHYTVSVAAYYDGMPAGFLSVEIDSCRYAATRRAIVRAAAAIGEKL